MGLQSYSSCHEKRLMDVYGWVFNLQGHFCVWQFKTNSIFFNITVFIALFNSFYLPTIFFTVNTIISNIAF